MKQFKPTFTDIILRDFNFKKFRKKIIFHTAYGKFLNIPFGILMAISYLHVRLLGSLVSSLTLVGLKGPGS